MADVLIRSFSKILSLLVGPTNVAIDNWTFQMFYKVTPMLLGACVILVCTRSSVMLYDLMIILAIKGLGPSGHPS